MSKPIRPIKVAVTTEIQRPKKVKIRQSQHISVDHRAGRGWFEPCWRPQHELQRRAPRLDGHGQVCVQVAGASACTENAWKKTAREEVILLSAVVG